MDIVCVRIKKIEQITSINEYMHYLKYLSEEKCQRLSQFIRKEDFLRSLVADLLIRVMLAKHLNLRNTDIKILTNSYGKPFLEGHSLEFNVSHSGEWIAAVVNHSPVGIDVEKIQPLELDIARRFFTEKECEELAAKNEYEKNQYFFDLWTLKESYIKACGQGLSIPLSSFSFSVVGEKIFFENDHSQGLFYFRQYHVHEQYKLAVCSSTGDFPLKVEIWGVEQLLDAVSQLL